MYPKGISIHIIVTALLIGTSGCTTATKDNWGHPRQESVPRQERVFNTKEEISVDKLTWNQIVILETKEYISVDIYTGDETNNIRNLKTNQLAIQIIYNEIIDTETFKVKGILIEAYDHSSNLFVRNRKDNHTVDVSSGNIKQAWKGELPQMMTEEIGDQTKSDESTNVSLFDATLALLQGEMYIAGFAAIFSKEPEDWGKVLIIISPGVLIAALEDTTIWDTEQGAWLTAAGVAAYGSWLLDQEDEEESELFKTQFLGLNVLLWSVVIYQYAFDSDNYSEQSQFFLETDPIDHGIKLTYKIEF